MGGEEQKQRRRVIIHRLMYVLPVILGFAVLWVLNATSPLNVGPAGILLVFLLFYAFFLSTFFLLIHILFRILPLIGVKGKLPVRKIYYLATVIAFLPVFLLALNSIGQLGFQDVILVVAFVTVAGFYMVRRTD